MFPSDLIKDMVYVKADVNVHLYRRFQNVNVVTHREWKHKDQDAAPIDFAIWNPYKTIYEAKETYSLASLKREL